MRSFQGAQVFVGRNAKKKKKKKKKKIFLLFQGRKKNSKNGQKFLELLFFRVPNFLWAQNQKKKKKKKKTTFLYSSWAE
jgi:hypothetical protein